MLKKFIINLLFFSKNKNYVKKIQNKMYEIILIKLTENIKF